MGNHDYDDFEESHERWPAAERLIAAVARDINNGRDPGGPWHPAFDVDALITQWLEPGTVVCQDPRSGNCPGPQSCGRRCTVGYWRTHGEDVSENMALLAGPLHQDVETWRLVGRIHDVDYPKGAHHDPAVSSERAHPLGLATQLHELGAPPDVVLAILAHAPHLRLRPASPLSWALLACDEHATMTAYANNNPVMEPAYPERLQPLAALLRRASSTIKGGFRRSDMQGRLTLGLQKLLDYRNGAIPSFDRRQFAGRIDWDAEIAAAEAR